MGFFVLPAEKTAQVKKKDVIKNAKFVLHFKIKYHGI